MRLDRVVAINPLESLKSAICFSSVDFSSTEHLAWIYGIAVGWDDSLPSITIQYNWDVSTVNRLVALHRDYVHMQTTKPKGTIDG